ncbi:MAG: hypothetical protein AAF390_05570 [Pseudomonadota bacterium]
MADARAQSGSTATVEALALAASLAWLALVAWMLLRGGDGADASQGNPLQTVLVIVAILLPVALIWIAVLVARTARAVRQESARLQAAVDGLRLSYVDGQADVVAVLRQEVDARIGDIARAQASLGAEIAALSAPRPDDPIIDAPTRPTAPEPQSVLALEPADAVEPQALPPDDFVRAFDFPEGENDEEGFRVLRAALDHPPTADLVRAAQDVLTLLAQDGIYMDDLAPHRPPVAVWRAFADGDRGSDVAALAGIGDRSSLALTGGRMKEDSVFRDAIHQFLRHFDRVFASFEETATDEEILRFANTRTGRAFMLTGKVAGSFG